MNHKHTSFHKSQLLRKVCIEKGGDYQDGDNEERARPGVVNIPRVVRHKEALDLGSCKERTKGHSDLPAEDAKPADDVA